MSLRALLTPLAAILLVVITNRPAPAQSDAGYEIHDPSAYQEGCYGPCVCPIRSLGMSGTFRLVFEGADPLYRHYRVENFDAVVSRPAGPVRLQGSGTYRVGGEAPILEQMTLDLTAEGSSEHFDSGLVAGGEDFPEITVRLAANAFACHDTVLVVDASPASAGIRPGGAGAIDASAVRAAPNPFRISTELRLSQAAAGLSDVEVFDAAGRMIATLEAAAWHPAGERIDRWDGCADGGGAAPAGVYFVRVRAPGGDALRRVVKLE